MPRMSHNGAGADPCPKAWRVAGPGFATTPHLPCLGVGSTSPSMTESVGERTIAIVDSLVVLGGVSDQAGKSQRLAEGDGSLNDASPNFGCRLERSGWQTRRRLAERTATRQLVT
jgi:hypothetical protein